MRATNVSQFARPKGPGKRRHIVADTLLPMMCLGLRKLGNICCGHKMFLNKIRNIFVSRTQNLCPQQMLRALANGETFVSATMCAQQCVLVYQGLYFVYSLQTTLATFGIETQTPQQIEPIQIWPPSELVKVGG